MVDKFSPGQTKGAPVHSDELVRLRTFERFARALLTSQSASIAAVEARATALEAGPFYLHLTELDVAVATRPIFFLGVLDRAATVVDVWTVRDGTGFGAISIDWQLSHHPTFLSGAANDVFLAAETTDTDNVTNHTPDDDDTIPAGSAVWVTLSNEANTVTEWGITVKLTWD